MRSNPKELSMFVPAPEAAEETIERRSIYGGHKAASAWKPTDEEQPQSETSERQVELLLQEEESCPDLSQIEDAIAAVNQTKFDDLTEKMERKNDFSPSPVKNETATDREEDD